MDYIKEFGMKEDQVKHYKLDYNYISVTLLRKLEDDIDDEIGVILDALVICMYKAYYYDKQRDNARQRAKRTAGNMTQAQRSERARKAAAKRWHKDPDTLSLNTVQNLKLENAINKKFNKQKQAK